MTSNGWIGIIKSRAKSVQETAKSQLGKLTETVDKKLQEVQSELEKYLCQNYVNLNRFFIFYSYL